MFEGFRPHELQTRILRIILDRIAPVKIVFRDFVDFCDIDYFLSAIPPRNPAKLIINHGTACNRSTKPLYGGQV